MCAVHQSDSARSWNTCTAPRIDSGCEISKPVHDIQRVQSNYIKATQHSILLYCTQK
jgi:hypothetical protein